MVVLRPLAFPSQIWLKSLEFLQTGIPVNNNITRSVPTSLGFFFAVSAEIGAAGGSPEPLQNLGTFFDLSSFDARVLLSKNENFIFVICVFVLYTLDRDLTKAGVDLASSSGKPNCMASVDSATRHLQTQEAAKLCVAGLASADIATSATSAAYSAFLTALATDLLAFVTPSSTCSASPKSFSTPCHPLRSSSPDSLFSPRPRIPVDTPEQPPLRQAGRRPSSTQHQTYHPPLTLSLCHRSPLRLLVSIQLKPVAVGEY
jgi:hypothetical protein